MTAVDVDALDKLREALAEAMASSARGNTYAQWAATILPVVVQFATERAAAELRAVACEAMETTPGAQRVHVPVSDLFDRAAALRASNGEGT